MEMKITQSCKSKIRYMKLTTITKNICTEITITERKSYLQKAQGKTNKHDASFRFVKNVNVEQRLSIVLE